MHIWLTEFPQPEGMAAVVHRGVRDGRGRAACTHRPVASVSLEPNSLSALTLCRKPFASYKGKDGRAAFGAAGGACLTTEMQPGAVPSSSQLGPAGQERFAARRQCSSAVMGALANTRDLGRSSSLCAWKTRAGSQQLEMRC